MNFFTKSASRLELLQQMMERTGSEIETDFALSGGQNLKSAMVACLGCKHEEACKSWLALNEGKAPAPGFCANADRLNALNDH
ncbi:MAG: DUF6455 family protein [Pseudomonadota bacterium]